MAIKVGADYLVMSDGTIKDVADIGSGGVITGPDIISNPGLTDYKITGLRLDSSKHIVVTYDDVPGGATGNIFSNPGPGEYKVKALRLNSLMKIVVVYDGTPEP